MIKIRASCSLSGDHFPPRLAEARTGLRFNTKNEVGELGKTGLYRGNPMPEGRATLEAPFDTQTQPGTVSPEEWVVNVIGPYIDELRSSGATSIELDLAVTWQDQCNLAFDAEFLHNLGKINIDLTMSCYEGAVGECWQDEDEITKG